MKKLKLVMGQSPYMRPLLFVGLLLGLCFFSFSTAYALLSTPPTIQGVLGCPAQATECKVNQILPGGTLQVRVSGVGMAALQEANATITLNGVGYTTDYDASTSSLVADIPAYITPGNYTLTIQGNVRTVTWPTTLPTGALVSDPDNPTTPVASGAQCGGGVLGGLGCIRPQFDPKGSVAGAQNIGDFIIAIINVLLGLLFAISVLFIIIGGYQYVTSAGKEDQAKSGRRTVTYAVIGVAISILSYMIVRVVEGTVSK